MFRFVTVYAIFNSCDVWQVILELDLHYSSAVEGDAVVINQLRGELHEAQQQVQQMRTQLLAAEEDAQLHAQDVSAVDFFSKIKVLCCCNDFRKYRLQFSYNILLCWITGHGTH